MTQHKIGDHIEVDGKRWRVDKIIKSKQEYDLVPINEYNTVVCFKGFPLYQPILSELCYSIRCHRRSCEPKHLRLPLNESQEKKVQL